MDVIVNVVNQRLKIQTNLKNYVAGTQKFVRFFFMLPSEWDNLLTFAQFSQDGKSYNQYLDSENSVYLPTEIKAGTCTLMLYGTGGNVVAATNYIVLTIDENIVVHNASSTEFSTTLYSQLVNKLSAVENWKAEIENDVPLQWIDF